MKKNNPQPSTKEFLVMKRIFSLSIYFPFLLILSALVMTFSGCGLFEPGNALLEENKIESDDDATGGEDLIDCNGDSDDTPTTSGTNLVFFGTLSGSFNSPLGMTAADDKLYVADSLNNQVKIYNNLAGIPNLERTLGTMGSAVADDTGFNYPGDTEVANGKLYVADKDNHRVQIYNLPIVDNDKADATIGTGSAVTIGNAGFNEPHGVEVANGKLYVADWQNHRIQIYNLSSGTPVYERTLGTGAAVTSGNNGFNLLEGVVIANGRLYVADRSNHRIQIYNNLSGVPTYERTIGITGTIKTDNTGFNRLSQLAIANGRLYVPDRNNHRVQIYTNLSGVPTYERTIGITGTIKTDNTGFNDPYGVAVHGRRLYVADQANARIQIYEWR